MRAVIIRERRSGDRRKIVRGPVGGNHRLKRAKAYQLYECWLAGMTVRKAAQFALVAKNTAMTYFSDFNWVLGHRQCLCGKRVGHRGWCRKLYLESTKRQATVRQLHVGDRFKL